MSPFSHVSKGINRNIVECKFLIYSDAGRSRLELIETLWNVNVVNQVLREIWLTELIETLWNVNAKQNIKMLDMLKAN